MVGHKQGSYHLDYFHVQSWTLPQPRAWIGAYFLFLCEWHNLEFMFISQYKKSLILNHKALNTDSSITADGR